MDKISVIIPTYNRAKSIKKAILSVLKQTYENIEVIIIDDGSKDNTESIVKSIKDKRIKYIKLNKNHGANYARNVGIKKSSGKYISFQDSDDIFLEDKLEKQLIHLKESNSDLNFHRAKVHIGKNIYDFPEIDEEEMKNKDWIRNRLTKGNIISTQTILCKKDIFNDISFDENLPRLQDYDLVLRISNKYKISYLNEFLSYVYRSDDSISNDDEKLKKACLYMLHRDYSLDENQQENLDNELIRLYNMKLDGELEQLRAKNYTLETEYNAIVNSKRWKLINKFLKKFGK